MCLSRWHWVFQKTAEAKRIKERTPLTLILTLTLTPTLTLTLNLTRWLDDGRIVGRVYGKPGCKDGTLITTSAVHSYCYP